MEIPRFYGDLGQYIEKGRVLVIFGPRRVGKTTIIQEYLQTTKFRYKFDIGDELSIRHIFGSLDFSQIHEYVTDNELIVIDEAHMIPDIGRGLKILVDRMPEIRVIVSGSSSFELAGQVGEPLTGRKNTLVLYPIAQLELAGTNNIYDLKKSLPERLVYGSYPQIVVAESNARRIKLLEELTESYLLKDILTIDKIKNSKLLLDLLRLMAFQVGSEVSHSELGNQLGTNKKTIGRYLDLLEKSFILYNLRGYSRNLREEVTRKSKYYFYDNGVRNAIISNFNAIDQRNDIGALWENFLMMERIKYRSYKSIYSNVFFWRTWDQKEIDCVEEREGKLFGYEFKWSGQGGKHANAWRAAYPNAEFEVISKDNYLRYISNY